MKKRLLKLKAGKPVRFNLQNSPIKYPGINNKYCYQSNIHNLIYKGAHFKNAKYMNCIMTSCNFRGAFMNGVDFFHTNLKNTRFDNAEIKNCVFFSCKIDNTDCTNSKFENVLFISTNTNNAIGLANQDGWQIIKSYPKIELGIKLSFITLELAKYESLFRPRVLHVNANKPNLWIFTVLLDRYKKETVVKALYALNRKKEKRNFYTLYSYIKYIDSFVKI